MTRNLFAFAFIAGLVGGVWLSLRARGTGSGLAPRAPVRP